MDDGAISDTNARKNGAVGADVYIFANVHLRSYGGAATALDRFGVGRGPLGIDGHIGPNGCIPSDRDSPRVQ